MSYGRNDEKLQHVRSILTAMDRSIEAARAKRENPEGPRAEVVQQVIGQTNGKSFETSEPRLPTSIFDRSGPRLKARPKRSSGE